MIYLDYNASAPLRPQAKIAILETLEWEGNPSSPHGAGRKLRAVIDEGRHRIKDVTGAKKVIFTSGGTEANALVLSHFAKGPVLVSSLEHDAVLKNAGLSYVIPAIQAGVVDMNALEKQLASFETPGLLSIMLVNNETGVLQPIREASKMARLKGWKVHTDAVQAVGHVPLSCEDLGVDFMTLSSHKCGGPIGIGALVMREEVALTPLIRGGGQEYGLRSGTLSAALVAGFKAAFVAALDEEITFIALLRQRIETQLPEAKVYGNTVPRIPGTVCLGMPGVPLDLQLMAFDLKGIAVGAGSACSSGTMKPSHVLVAMGVNPEAAQCALRVSMGWNTQSSDVDAFIQGWKEIYGNHLQKEVS